MPPQRIIIIRHAEKPVEGFRGVGPDGVEDPDDLIVRGWQRAGALARLFAPSAQMQGRLETPGVIFAAGVGPGSDSKRHTHTVEPLAALLGLAVDATFLKGQILELAQAVLRQSGVALICWEHKEIRRLVELLGPAKPSAPDWPAERFDMSLVLEPVADGWDLHQQPQLLLAGDSAEPLA